MNNGVPPGSASGPAPDQYHAPVGIEGERLVLDYLSQVGDLAHTTSMSAAERRALVGRLRDEIVRQRSGAEDGDAAVARILRGIGRPEDVVAAASSDAAQVPAPRPAPETLVDDEPAGPPPREPAPVEWRDGRIDGFTGGIVDPDMLRPGIDLDKPGPEVPVGEAGPAGEASPAEPEPPGRPKKEKAPRKPKKERDGSRSRAGLRRARAALGGAHVGGVFELLAASLLFAGSAAGSLWSMLAGGLLGYWSPRLSRREAKWAVFGMPATVVGGYVVYLFGRVNEYWGTAPGQGELRAALLDAYPVLIRLAAFASAAFLFWRALRRPPAED